MINSEGFEMNERWARELARLNEERGKLEPVAVVAEAKSEDSPLHDAFEWDDFKAGHQYRLVQARTLIRRVRVTYKGQDVPGYVHVPKTESDEGGYYSVEAVCRNQDLFDKALRQLVSHMNAAQRAVEDLHRIAEDQDEPRKVEAITAASAALRTASDVVASIQ